MSSQPAQLLRKVFDLGSGELLARIFSVAVVILLGHKYGVVILGAYSLAQGITQYLLVVIDFGLRHIGARLIARFPSSASDIMRRVQRRRIGMAAAALPFVLLYAFFARFPLELRIFLFLFPAAGALYALSLEWAAWGREKLRFVGLAKALVSLSILIGLLCAFGGDHLLTWLIAGNLMGYSSQAIVLWVWWRRHQREIGDQQYDVAHIRHELQWGRTSILGLAWLGNAAFNTSDMLLLGTFSNPQQVGLYSASYRILNQVLVTYYLLTSVLYPQFARHHPDQRPRLVRPAIFLSLFGAGAVVAVLVGLLRRPLLHIVFGRPFVAAAPLLMLLAWCVPLDFMVSYLSNAYLAWSMERRVLLSAAVATIVNVALNLATVPRYGAMAAAVNTLISYAIYFTALLLTGRRPPQAFQSTVTDVDA